MGDQPQPERRPKLPPLLRRFPEYRRDLTLADEAGRSLEEYDALPEFERGLREARWAERQDRHSCGLPRSVCSDPARKFYPQREIDYAAMEREAANEKWKRLHEARPWHDGSFKNWAAERSGLTPYHRDHGVTIGVAETDVRPNDLFLTHESWGPEQIPDPDVDELAE